MPPNIQQMPQGMPQQQMEGIPLNNGQIPQNILAQPTKRFNLLIIPVIVLSILLLAMSGFAFWAFTEMQDYKNNSDKKVADAVEVAKQETETQKDKEFVEKEKNPYRQYLGPSTFGSVKFDYPKTWSAFITESNEGSAGTALNGYLHPNFVPGLQSGTDFGLRFQVVSRTYSDVIGQYDSKVKQGKLSVTAYKSPNVTNIKGVRIEGEINRGQKDAMIVVPLRDKTLIVWTESVQYLNDFNNIVLPSLVFVP